MLDKFFARLTDTLKVPLRILQYVAEAIGDLFGVGDTSGIDSFTSSIDDLNKKLDPFGKFIDIAGKAWDAFTQNYR